MSHIKSNRLDLFLKHNGVTHRYIFKSKLKSMSYNYFFIGVRCYEWFLDFGNIQHLVLYFELRIIMRIFKTKRFAKWATKEGLDDKDLYEAIMEMDVGLIDVKLGGHVFKKRVALHGRGKRAGARTLVAFKVEDKAFFIFGFAKNKLENIEDDQLSKLKLLASVLLGYNDKELREALKEREIIEVTYHE